MITILATPHGARRLAGALALGLLTLVVRPTTADAVPCTNVGVPGTPYEGFAADTRGGLGKPVYRVTHLGDKGRGSLRDALAAGDRCIVFEVGGDVQLRSQIYVKGGFVTVDGFTAPAPGITLRDYGIAIWGTHGAHEVILRGLRFRNSGQSSCAVGRVCYDGVQIKRGASRVVVDHVSSDQAADGALDIGPGSPGNPTRDITVQWSILSGTRNQVLIQRAMRVSMHHNLFINGPNRNPQVDWDSTLSTTPPDTMLDFRNNLIWNFAAYGTIVRRNATANVVQNYYHATGPGALAFKVDRQGRAHATGNYSANDANVDAHGTETVQFPAPSVTTTDPCTAAHAIRAGAGARGLAFSLDAVDRHYIAQMSAALPDCSSSTASEAVRSSGAVDTAGGSTP